MKLTDITLYALCSITCISFAGRIKMPDATTLNTRLNEEGFDHFAQKTNIVTQLADKEFAAVTSMALIVEQTLSDFNKTINDTLNDTLMDIRKPALYEALLRDLPGELTVLQTMGIYNPE